MDSSVKYVKFATVNENNSEKKRQKISFAHVVIIIVLVSIALLVAAAIAIGVAVSESASKESGESADSGLTLNTINQEELQGEYSSATGGIRFKITVNDSYVFLSFNTTSGEPVVNILNVVPSSMTMMGINSTSFLVMKNRPGRAKYVGYVVPQNYTDMVNSMMTEQREMPEDILEHLDNTTVNETRQISLEALAVSPEADLIIQAALELGRTGVLGTSYPPVSSFYLLALQLAKLRAFMEGTAPHRFTRDAEMSNSIEQKRAAQCSQRSGGGVCAVCPYEAFNNDCFGLCGYGCNCWSWVCGDCCVHNFCRTHDYCCYVNGFFSFDCFAVAWNVFSGFQCTQNYDC